MIYYETEAEAEKLKGLFDITLKVTGTLYIKDIYEMGENMSPISEYKPKGKKK